MVDDRLAATKAKISAAEFKLGQTENEVRDLYLRGVCLFAQYSYTTHALSQNAILTFTQRALSEIQAMNDGKNAEKEKKAQVKRLMQRKRQKLEQKLKEGWGATVCW